MDEVHSPFSISDSTSTEEAFCLIDAAIERYHASLLALKHRRNAFAPISRLPSEIVCEIFSIMKKEEPSLPRPLTFGGSPLGWVRVTHVSHHWRNVGIDSPSLWDTPPLANLRWAELMLSRSKNSPLVIEFQGIILSRFIPALKLVLEHSQRIKILSVGIDSYQWRNLQKAFPESAPQLEYLRLESSNDFTAVIPVESNSQKFLRETPKLRRLELTDLELNWNTHSHLLHALTHLKIHNVSASFRMPWRRFADVLSEMPDLQVLDLKNALPVDTDDQVPLASIHLASLQALSINCQAKLAETFFSFITFPLTTMTKIECHISSTVSANADFSVVLRRLVQSYANLSPDEHFQTLILLAPTPSLIPGIRFRLFVDALADEQMVAHNNIPARLDCMFAWTPSSPNLPFFTKAMNDIFSCGIPLQNISRVYLAEHIYHLKPETLATTVGKLGQVRSFMVASYAGTILVDALNLGAHNWDKDEKSVPSETSYFRNLSSIYLHGSTFRSLDVYQGAPVADPYRLSVQSLINCLIQRSRSGAGSVKLILRGCRKLYKGDVDLIRKAVDDVDWDEREISFDSDDEDDEDEYNSEDEDEHYYEDQEEYLEDEDVDEDEDDYGD